MRHLIGGCRDEVGKALLGRGCYNGVSCLNRHHMRWAWCSLFGSHSLICTYGCAQWVF